MKKGTLYLMLIALIAAIFLVLQCGSATKAEKNIQTQVTQQIESSRNIEPVGFAVQEGAIPKDSRMEALSKSFTDAQLALIKPLIESFWQGCQSRSDCDELLVELQNLLSSTKYQLLAQYPAKMEEFKQLSESEDFQTGTAEKVMRIKSLYRQVWGEHAPELFNQAFVFYDSRATLDELTQLSKGLQQSDFLEQMELMSEQGKLPQDKHVLYSMAVEVLGTDLSPTALSHLKGELAQRYFDKGRAQAILARQHQVIEQQKRVNNYQQALKEIQAQLKQSRETEFAHLSDAQWQSQYEAQIRVFRKSFFQVD